MDTPKSLAAELADLSTRMTDSESELITTIGDAITRLSNQREEQWRQQEALTARIANLPSGQAPTFPGDPGPGRIRWGAAIGGNADPVARHEVPAGTPMGLRRTFWNMAKAPALIATASADLAAGRLPWVSVKLGVTWAEAAAGRLDAAFMDLFAKLDALGGPVWFTVHHEPEGGGGRNVPDDGPGTEASWRQMQAHVRTLLDRARTKNIAFAPILMSWTFDPRSGRRPEEWWVPDVWDFAGIDHYLDDEAGKTIVTQAWANTRAFYETRGLRIAIGEWGNRGADAAAASEMREWRNHLISIGSPGAAYFDSSLNSPTGAWTLTGEPLAEFRRLMRDPASVRG